MFIHPGQANNPLSAFLPRVGSPIRAPYIVPPDFGARNPSPEPAPPPSPVRAEPIQAVILDEPEPAAPLHVVEDIAEEPELQSRDSASEASESRVAPNMPVPRRPVPQRPVPPIPQTAVPKRIPEAPSYEWIPLEKEEKEPQAVCCEAPKGRYECWREPEFSDVCDCIPTNLDCLILSKKNERARQDLAERRAVLCETVSLLRLLKQKYLIERKIWEEFESHPGNFYARFPSKTLHDVDCSKDSVFDTNHISNVRSAMKCYHETQRLCKEIQKIRTK